MVLQIHKILFLLITLSLTWGCKESPKVAPTEEAPVSRAQPQEPEPEEDVGGQLQEDTGAETPPVEIVPPPMDVEAVRIRITPRLLEVLQTNTVTLHATLPPDRPEANCRWILSGGADEAADGCESELQLTEVADDIGWTLVVTEETTEVLRREGAIPLERLWVEGQELPREIEQDPELQLAPRSSESEAGKPLSRSGGENTEEIEWSMTPAELGVLQDTEVVLSADALDDAVCSWDFGDGAAPQEGCKLTRLFREAHADLTVTLTVVRGDSVVYSSARILPLERLSVTPRTPEPEGDLPQCGDGCRRLAVAAVRGGGLDRAYALASRTGAAALVLFLHEPLPAPSAVEDLARYLGARNIGLLPVACGDGLGRDALASLLTNHALPAGLVLHSDTADLPERYAMQWGPAFLAALPTRADIPDEKWLTGQLETAAMFRTRLLLTCRAFDRLTSTTPPLLPSPYRQYEKMRRGGLKLFVSGAHEAFYPGTYGNLRTLSPGRLQGPSAALLGQDGPAGPTAALVDIGENRIKRIIGVVPAGESWAPYPEENLPEKVGVYRIWK